MASDIIAPTRALVPAPSRFALLDADVFDAEEIAATQRHSRASKADNTLRSYASDWRSFTAWAAGKGLEPLPCSPGPLCVYLSHLAAKGLSAPTIERHRAAVGHYHRAGGYLSPAKHDAVVEHMRGIRHSIGIAPRRQKTPLTADLVLRLLNACPDTLIGARDRAMFALGFSAALRRSELVALEVADLTEVPDGFRVLIRRSKTDQAGEGQEIAVPRGIYLRPVEAVQQWLCAAEISTGPVFRVVAKGGKLGEPLSDDGYVRAIKRRSAAAGLDAALFSGHSMRSGFCTSAAEAGADVLKVAEVTRHKSLDVLRRYVRRADLFKGHSGASFLAWACLIVLGGGLA